MTILEGKGQVALVTGASRGIGAAIAYRLAENGFQVVGTATTQIGADKITNTLSPFQNCFGVCLNVNELGAVDTLVETVAREKSGLHVVVNNAGITRDTLAVRMKDEDWDAVIDTNLKAVFRLTRAALRPMMKQRFGRIINITSVVGVSGNPGQANYAAAKAGVAGMTRSLAREVGSRGITVNCVAPGFIDTDMTSTLSIDQQNALKAQIPLGHLGRPSDVAGAVAYLASADAAYITGQELHVNGGMYM